MRTFIGIVIILFVFAMVAVFCYALYDAGMKKSNIGKSVILNGDTLKIVEWTQHGNLYVLENGIIFKYE